MPAVPAEGAAGGATVALALAAAAAPPSSFDAADAPLSVLVLFSSADVALSDASRRRRPNSDMAERNG